MKRFTIAALAAAVMIAGPLSARAHTDKGRKDGDKASADCAAKMQQRMNERLALNDDQAAKFEAALKSARAEMTPLREKERAAERRLADVVGAGSDDEVASALKDDDAARKALMDERQKLEASLASILTPRQFAKLRVDRARMRHGRFGMMGRGDRGQGPEGWGQQDRGQHQGWDGGEQCRMDGPDRGHDRGASGDQGHGRDGPPADAPGDDAP